jgi:sugar phosphate isomerase/epimerase
MNNYSRRTFGKLALSGATLSLLPIGARVASAFESRGVKVGLITGSLNPLPEVPGRDPIDVIIDQCLELNVQDVELVTVYPEGQPEVADFMDRAAGRFGQPPDIRTPAYLETRPQLRAWRLAYPLDRFVQVREKFQQAGLNLFSYVQTIDDDMTDDEMDAVFKQMQALGVGIFTTNQTRVGIGPRLAPFCERYGIKAAWHPHDKIDDPNEVATVQSMETLLAMSQAFVINLDIGHFTAGNGDSVAFLRKHHDRITHLHIKDRLRDHGDRVMLGTGDTPIRECATLIRDNRWPIMLIVEREYRDAPGTPVEQTRWELNFLKNILEA